MTAARVLHLKKLGPRGTAGASGVSVYLSLCGKSWNTRKGGHLTEARAAVTCGKCLRTMEMQEGRQARARRVRLQIRNADGYWYYCPYCDSRSIYRSRALTTRERSGGEVVSYWMICRCCGHRGWTNHPKAVNQLSPEMLDGDVAHSENVDVQQIIEDYNNAK